MNELREVILWLNSVSGLNVDAIGVGALQGAINQRIAELNLPNVEHYLGMWRDSAEEQEMLQSRVLVGETWFFREQAAFQLLQVWIEGFRDRWRPGRPLRILVLPCSTGEEAWSVASVVRSSGVLPGSVEIEAMDINRAALLMAATGRYSLRKARKRPMPQNLGCLENDELEIDDELKRLVRFERVNVLDRNALATKPAYDVIFLRNLLIYMDERARHRIFEKVSEVLLENGLLFLGHAEHPPMGEGWNRLPAPGAFAWQRSGSKAPSLGFFPSGCVVGGS